MKVYKCPVCNGTGLVSRPTYITGDQEMWTSYSTGPYICKCCQGFCVVYVADPIIKIRKIYDNSNTNG